MAVDLSQFHQVFFEESLDGLDAMEAALMELDPNTIDEDIINTIFRAAHSIKGGSATFGFSVIVDFTHILETLLDQVRDGKRGVSPDNIDLYLQSVDCMRGIINVLQSGGQPDTRERDRLTTEFQALLDNAPNTEVEVVNHNSPTSESAKSSTTQIAVVDKPIDSSFDNVQGWKIYFKPGQSILAIGNEPLRMFRELSALGTVRIKADVSEIPSIIAMEPVNCYLSWQIEVTGRDIEKAAIEEIFEWVVDESDITIELLDSPLAESSEPVEIVESISKSLSPPQSTSPSPTKSLPQKLLPEESMSPLDESVEHEELAAEMAREIALDFSPAERVDNVTKSSDPQKKSSQSGPRTQKTNHSGSDTSIRVGIEKVDDLINMVGELVITQSMLSQLGNEYDPNKREDMQRGLSQLAQKTRDLQESVMRIRMLPISFIFSRFPRMIRDLSRMLDKQIDLILLGETTEMDKTVMEKIGDPLVHLVRNSCDHGIEHPEDRLAAGKPEKGTITLNAYHQGGNIIVQIIDDGGGLNKKRILARARERNIIGENEILTDQQIHELIFQPGFSTVDQVSDISGRGVGMDVVKRNIQELNGNIDITSIEGKGSTFTISLPLTLAIVDGQLARVVDQIYIFPLITIVESIQLKANLVNKIAGSFDVFRLRNEFIPIVSLWDLLGMPSTAQQSADTLMVVVESGGEKIGLVVDELLGQQQVVIKSLEANYQRIEGISGATILGDGTVALIVDIAGLMRIAGIRQRDLQMISHLSANMAVDQRRGLAG